MQETTCKKLFLTVLNNHINGGGISMVILRLYHTLLKF